MSFQKIILSLCLTVLFPLHIQAQESVRDKMDYVFEVFSSLFYYTAEEARFNDPANRQEIERLIEELPGLALAGNAYRGVGIPQCIHSGEQAAERVASAWA